MTDSFPQYTTLRGELLQEEDGSLIARAPWYIEAIAGAVVGLFPVVVAMEYLAPAGYFEASGALLKLVLLVPCTLLGVWLLRKFNRPLRLDKGRRDISDGRRAIRFDDVRHVEIEENHRRGSPWSVWLRLNTGRRIHVLSINNEHACAEHAAAAARLIGRDVVLV